MAIRVPPTPDEDDVFDTVLNPATPPENRPRCPECDRPADWWRTVIRHTDAYGPCTVPATVVTVCLPCGHTVRLGEALYLHMQRPVELVGTDDDSRDRWWFGPEPDPMTI